MSEHRGRPLPLQKKFAIQHFRDIEGVSVRETARIVGVDKETVVKYGPPGVRAERQAS